jgi:hypothetical protein
LRHKANFSLSERRGARARASARAAGRPAVRVRREQKQEMNEEAPAEWFRPGTLKAVRPTLWKGTADDH